MCPFVKSGECEIPPCKDCYLPCSEKEKNFEEVFLNEKRWKAL